MTENPNAAAPVVLLLQDEPLLSMALADYIEEAGCQVVEVTSVDEAVNVLEQRPDIRVVVADLDVRGEVLKLALRIRDRWPPIELLLTGCVEPSAASMPLRGVYFDKPLHPHRFIASLRRFTM